MPEEQDHIRHWRRAREIFELATDAATPDEQQAILIEHCNGNSSLRADVERLLGLQQKPELAVDQPAFGMVRSSLLTPASPEAFLKQALGKGRYQLIRHIASGGMGDVFAAIDLKSGGPVAVKILRQHWLVAREQDNVRARFEREAASAAKIDHPNVCRVLDIHLESEPAFCVMELLEGPTLAEHLAADGPLMPVDALPMVTGICAGLQAAHDAGVIHRDLKPGNIILSKDRSGEPVIIDFGLATALDRDQRDLTKTGDVIGTLAYIAPELLEQGGGGTPSSDIYSLGVILFEMLTGAKPHTAVSPLRLVMQRARSSGALPALRTAGVPPVWREVVERCLSADPQRRFSSAGQVTERLNTRRPSWQFQLARRRCRVAVAAAGLLAVAAIGGSVWNREYSPSNGAAALYRSAQNAAAAGAPFRATELLEQAVQRDPDYVSAHSLLAVEYAELDQLDKAREQMLGASLARERRWRLGPIERQLQEASRAEVVHDLKLAAELYGKAAESFSDPATRSFATLSQVRVLERAARTGDALRVVERLVKRQPSDLAAKVRYGRLLCRRRRFDEAATQLEAARQAYVAAGDLEGESAALLVRATILRRGDSASDRRDLGRIRELAAKTGNQYQDLRATFRLVMIEAQASHVDEAIKMVTDSVARARALGMNSLAASALGDLGYALYIGQRFEESRTILQQAVDLAVRSRNPATEASNRMRLAEVLSSQQLRRRDEAVRIMEPAIKWYRDAGYDDILPIVLPKWAGLLSADPARLQESEQALVEALRLAQRNGEAGLQVLVLQRLSGIAEEHDLRKSIAYWDRTVPLAKLAGIPAVYTTAARAHSRIGDFVRARELFDQVESAAKAMPAGVGRQILEAQILNEQAFFGYRLGSCVPALRTAPPYDSPSSKASFTGLINACLPAMPRSVLERDLRELHSLAKASELATDRFWAGILLATAAQVSLRLGDFSAAMKTAEQANNHFVALGYSVRQMEVELVLRKALRKLGKRQRADEVEAQVLQLARQVGFPEPVRSFGGRRDLQRLWAD